MPMKTKIRRLKNERIDRVKDELKITQNAFEEKVERVNEKVEKFEKRLGCKT